MLACQAQTIQPCLSGLRQKIEILLTHDVDDADTTYAYERVQRRSTNARRVRSQSFDVPIGQADRGYPIAGRVQPGGRMGRSGAVSAVAVEATHDCQTSRHRPHRRHRQRQERRAGRSGVAGRRGDRRRPDGARGDGAGRPGVRRIVAEFGRDILAPDGQIDRGQLGRRVFADPAALARLEAIVHPAVGQAIRHGSPRRSARWW